MIWTSEPRVVPEYLLQSGAPMAPADSLVFYRIMVIHLNIQPSPPLDAHQSWRAVPFPPFYISRRSAIRMYNTDTVLMTSQLSPATQSCNDPCSFSNTLATSLVSVMLTPSHFSSLTFPPSSQWLLFLPYTRMLTFTSPPSSNSWRATSCHTFLTSMNSMAKSSSLFLVRE